MMTEIKRWLAVSCLLLTAGRAWAINSQAGTSGAQFLKIGAGSRAGAMAEAYSAVADDVYALYYNPGALGRLREPQVAGAHTAYFQGSNYEFLGFAYPLKAYREQDYSKHVLGFAIYNLAVADIERRTGDSSAPLGTFGAGDYSYNLSYAYRVDRTLGLGVTGKVIYQTIDTYSSTALAMDLGAHYTPRPDGKRPLSFAAVIKNVGTRPGYAGGVSDPLPMALTLGVGGYVLPKTLKADLDVTKYRDSNPFLGAGGEYLHSFSEDVQGALRFGYSSHYTDNGGISGITLGAGINFHRATFDFAWIPFGDLGDTFRYSLHIRFGGAAAASTEVAAPGSNP